MSEKKFFKLIEKRGRVVLADLDNNILQPHEALKVAQVVSQGAQSKSYVYIGLRATDGLYKIGLTDNLARRKAELGVEFVHTIECDAYGDRSSVVVEAMLHKFFEGDRVEGEWFQLIDADIGFIKMNCPTAETTLSFIPEFEKVLSEISATLDEKGTSALLIDWLDGQMSWRQLQATYYLMRKLIQSAEKLKMEANAAVWQFFIETTNAQYERYGGWSYRRSK